ncbi:hypothetical protein SAMN05428961_11378 [Paenibacillus sp. OK060]|uniref:hypothetical protein n=1 Tax=Paenibacillus sp. OK060 TaxID=1881034 RepID=UPI00088DC66E|nr:hypothetical protein [Paenibacillus sp. OK060]SDM31455.1 hypothetical protein SAMN05428961_11378 [Paenibacillus sp. OK060]
MSKQYARTSGISEVMDKPLDNNILVEEIKAAILVECYPLVMAKKKEGSLKFSVRSGRLAINHVLEKKVLRPKSLGLDLAVSDNTVSTGMNRKGLRTLIMILDSVLKENEPIDHATILINYSVEENGDYADGELIVERGIHHARY